MYQGKRVTCFSGVKNVDVIGVILEACEGVLKVFVGTIVTLVVIMIVALGVIGVVVTLLCCTCHVVIVGAAATESN